MDSLEAIGGRTYIMNRTRERIEINYKSDFDFLLKLKGAGGETQSFPQFDFRGEIWPERALEYGEFDCVTDTWEETAKSLGIRPYVFYKEGQKTVNCREHEGGIHVIADNHGLPKGGLILLLKNYIPNPLYPDGIRTIEERHRLDIILVEGNGKDAAEGENSVELVTPYVYITAYMLARSAGFEGTEEEYANALNKITLLAGRAEQTIKMLEEMDSRIDEVKTTLSSLKDKLDAYPNSPAKNDDCVYSLLNGTWTPIAAPGELIIVAGGRDVKE